MAKQQPTAAITFEQGYERLKQIAERIDEEEVPVSELCELFAEGKGLERALSEYLAAQKTRLEEIERGEGVEAFKIIPAQPTGQELPSVAPARAAGDELPF